MKPISAKAFGLLMILLAIWIACNKETASPTANDLSPFAKKFLSLNSGTMNASAQSKNAAINQSYSGAVNSYQALSGNVSSGGDSSIVGAPWQSCATITEFDNSDGSHTIIYDYGLGCSDGYGDYKNFVKGKTIQTSKYTYQTSGSMVTTSYLYRYKYENYGGRYYFNNDSSEWSQNGGSSYTGESFYDTLNQQFSGGYDFSDTTDYSYGKDSYSYKSLGKSHYDQAKSVSEKNDYEYTSGDNYYKSVVTIPLVSDYTCYSKIGPRIELVFWLTYVSGHEVIHYRQDGQEGSFEIDYGNGECDNRITIVENGKVIPIDLGKDWAVLAASTGH